MQELRFWVPGWLVSLPLTQAVAHLPPPLPFLSVPPVLSYWPTPYRKQEQKQNNDHHRRNEGAHTAQLPTEEASSIACCPERNAPGSRFTPRPWAEQNPAAPPPGRYHTQSAPSLTRGLPWHSQRLGNVPSQPQGPWPLSPVTPATNQLGGILGPTLWELGLGSRGYSHGSVGKATQGGK